MTVGQMPRSTPLSDILGLVEPDTLAIFHREGVYTVGDLLDVVRGTRKQVSANASIDANLLIVNNTRASTSGVGDYGP